GGARRPRPSASALSKPLALAHCGARAAPDGHAQSGRRPPHRRRCRRRSPRSSFLDSDPALVRDVEDDAVRVAELALEVDAAAALQLAVKAPAVALGLFGVLLEVVDDEADVMQAVEILAALIARRVVGVELEQRQIDDAVGKR